MNRLKKVALRDIFGIFIFLFALFPSLVFRIYLKIKKEQVWLICETRDTARDNAKEFYKYMCENHKEIKTYYAINKNSHDYQEVKDYGNIIQWGSFKHYLYYMSSKWNISSHKEGNPNHTLFTILHLYLNLYNNRIFLQHGVLYQNHSMFHQKNTKFKMFIAGAKPEYEFIKEKYGYENGEVRYTGLARFDNLFKNQNCNDKDLIIYMPTWRRWFTSEKELVESKYYQGINSLINSKELDDTLSKYNKKMLFCPHVGLSKYNDVFETNCKNITILNTKNQSIQELLIKGNVLITDYSSIHTDFAFLHKAIIYYQYDEEEFKRDHIGKCADDTYYDFHEDGFGPVANTEEEVLKQLSKVLKNDGKVEKKYSERIESFFELHDDKNCERIYKEIMKG